MILKMQGQANEKATSVNETEFEPSSLVFSDISAWVVDVEKDLMRGQLTYLHLDVVDETIPVINFDTKLNPLTKKSTGVKRRQGKPEAASRNGS